MKIIYCKIYLAILLLGFNHANASPVRIVNLRCEYLTNPLGIDVQQPRLSWELTSIEKNQGQLAYQILVASDSVLLSQEKADLWDSGKVPSIQTNQIEYKGQTLKSRKFCYWKVRVWDLKNEVSTWSEVSYWSNGLLNNNDWQAKWIGAPPEQIPRRQQYYINHGYRSSTASSPLVNKWVTVDLGANHKLSEVRLYPVQPLKTGGWQTMYRDKDKNAKAYLFPVRFNIDISEYEDFRIFKTVANESGKDYYQDEFGAYTKHFKPEKARYVRVNVFKLASIDSVKYAFSLAELEVFGDSCQNIALDKPVKVSEVYPLARPFTAENWSAEVLTDGHLKANNENIYSLPVPPSPLLRKTFNVDKKVKKAMLYASALGTYEIRINGEKCGDRFLAPEWTDYHHRLQYQTYDVTTLLHDGDNAIGGMLSDGWYVGPVFSHSERGSYGFDRRLLAQLEINYADGTKSTIVTDDSWTIFDEGPIRHASIFDGELYDSHFRQRCWDQPNFNDTSWKKATIDSLVKVELCAQMNEPIKVIEEITPVNVYEKNGAYMVDIGQNIVGWVKLTLPYKTSSKIVVRYGEMLNKDSTLYTSNLRYAKQTDTYIGSNDENVLFEPRFTYHGFRYVEISGLAQRPSVNDITARVVASGSLPVGSFKCSNEDINQLWQNIFWTQRGNMHSIPTDCPQRDERAGWTGDAQVFSQTAIFNLDMAAFFTKWIKDIRDSQTEDGRFPDFAPQVGISRNYYNSPGWADVGVIVPWKVYLNYGDKVVLKEQYVAMKKFIEHIKRHNPGLIWKESRGNLYGDWLNGDNIIHENYPKTGGKVPDDLYATAFFAYSTRIVSQIAEILGQESDFRQYNDLAKKIRHAFVNEFINDDGSIRGNTQAGYALALEFDLVPKELKVKAAAHMVQAVKAYDFRISTGIQSTIRLMNQLSAFGYGDVAYRLLESRKFPSWLYSIDQGATTIWERWDGYVEGRGFQDPWMNSFNHYALGAVGEWMYTNILGINYNDEYPGYHQFIVKPNLEGNLKWARGAYHSIAGNIAVSWKKSTNTFQLDIDVPANTSSNVYFPSKDIENITESGMSVKENKNFELIGSGVNQIILKVGSGKYSFDVSLDEAPFKQ